MIRYLGRRPEVGAKPQRQTGRYHRLMSDEPFVPADFAVPGGLATGPFRLEPLGHQHNAADYAAWTASISHIRATPGFADISWPHPMSLADNLRDLERHAQDFAERREIKEARMTNHCSYLRVRHLILQHGRNSPLAEAADSDNGLQNYGLLQIQA